MFRLLGRPASTHEWTERHGSIEVRAAGHDYPGLRVQVNRSDRKVYAIGAMTRGGWEGCSVAILGTIGWQRAPDPATVTPGPLGVPLPKNMRIIPPGPDVSRERAAFSGIWSGVWVGGSPVSHVLVVEEIRPDRVVVIFGSGWGFDPRFPANHFFPPTWTRWAGRFSGTTLYLGLDRSWVGPTPRVAYHFVSDDALVATFDSRIGATMRRVRQ